MAEEDSQVVRPVAERGQNWQERQQKKQSLKSSHEERENQDEEFNRRPAPLPFGKLDVVA